MLDIIIVRQLIPTLDSSFFFLLTSSLNLPLELAPIVASSSLCDQAEQAYSFIWEKAFKILEGRFRAPVVICSYLSCSPYAWAAPVPLTNPHVAMGTGMKTHWGCYVVP